VTPSSIAVDTVDNHVYWVQYGLNGNIIRCNLNGSNETVILKNLHDTGGITLDSKRRYIFLYFSDIHIYVIFLPVCVLTPQCCVLSGDSNQSLYLLANATYVLNEETIHTSMI
jgi:hypothetical protein